jgi:cytochrome c biogenesis protein CcdA
MRPDVYLLIPFGGFALGLLVARWWVVAAAPVLGVYVLAANELEGHLGEWVAFSLSALLAFAIGCGVALRRLAPRR